MRAFVLFVCWPVTGVVIGQFLRLWMMPDSCLDMGGSFDYTAWVCDLHENHAFDSVRFYELTSFWLSVALLVASSVLSYVTSTRSPTTAMQVEQ